MVFKIINYFYIKLCILSFMNYVLSNPFLNSQFHPNPPKDWCHSIYEIFFRIVIAMDCAKKILALKIVLVVCKSVVSFQTLPTLTSHASSSQSLLVLPILPSFSWSKLELMRRMNPFQPPLIPEFWISSKINSLYKLPFWKLLNHLCFLDLPSLFITSSLLIWMLR